MTVVLAVLTVGLGSLLFRLAPLLGAHRLPDRASRLAGWAGLSVLTALTVRAVALHQDPTVPGAPVVAFLSVGVGLLLAFAGRSVLLAVASGAATYVVLAAAVATVH